jgi:hypothetical protein
MNIEKYLTETTKTKFMNIEKYLTETTKTKFQAVIDEETLEVAYTDLRKNKKMRKKFKNRKEADRWLDKMEGDIKIDAWLNEGVRQHRPRAGGGAHGDLITLRLKYYDFLVKQDGKSSKEAFNIAKDMNKKQLEKELKKVGMMGPVRVA